MHGSLKFSTHPFRYFDCLVSLSLISVLTLAVLMFSPPVITESKASATANATESFITLTSLANSATANVRALTQNGFFATSTIEQSASFALTTNNYTGYTLSIMSDDDDGNLSTDVEPGDVPETIGSIPDVTTTEDFSATTTAAESYNSKWGIRPSKYVDATNNTTVDNTGDNPVYLPSPTTVPTLLDKTTSANTTANVYTLAIGVRANQDTKSGIYTKVLGLAAIANPVSYTIEYDQNTDDIVTNMPATQANDSMSSTSLALSDMIPLRSHYSFIGWCDVQPTTTNGVDSCAGTIYNPNGDGTDLTYGIDQTTANEATLYAMWKIDTFTCNRQYRLQNVDGTWGEYQEDISKTVNYGDSCSYSKTIANYRAENGSNNSTVSASVSNITSDVTLKLDLYRNTYTCVKRYRLQNVDGTWGEYQEESSETVIHGGSCSYSKDVTGFHAYGEANDSAISASASDVASDVTLSLDLYRNTYTCTKRYRLQNADGSWGEYQEESSETVNYGGSCSYSKAVTDYKGSNDAANDTAGSISVSDITSDTTLDLDLYRNTYNLTVFAGSNTNSPTGSGTYRWGENINVGVTKASDTTCIAYDVPAWSQSGTVGSLSSVSGASTIFTMGKGDATVTAASVYSDIAQSIALSRSGGASSININGTDYTEDSVSLNCGTYDISGNYDSGYEFDSWSGSDVSVANASASSTTMTVSGAGALTLAGKRSKIYLQDVTSATCPTTAVIAHDSRDEETYAIQELADGRCWLLDNLRLDLADANVQDNLASSNTNASDTTLNYLKNGGGNTSDQYAITGVTEWDGANSFSYSDPVIATSGIDTNTGEAWTKDTLQRYTRYASADSGKIGIYYNYCAASAGSYCYGDGESDTGSISGNATEDICPAGWRMPSVNEYQALYRAYNSSVNDFGNALRVPLAGKIGYDFYDYFSHRLDDDAAIWSLNQGYMDEYMYSMHYSSMIFNGAESANRYEGFSVRCIIDPDFTSYAITYEQNTSDIVFNMPSSQIGTANSVRNRIVFSDKTPIRPGAAFLGWCDTQPTTSGSDDYCSGTKYQPGNSYTINTSSPDLTLYVMWRVLPPLTIQGITPSTCPTTPTQVYDTRDYEIYTIQKLTDGRCWLLDNLRLDLASAKDNITAANTNASENTLNYLKNGGGTASDKYATSGVSGNPDNNYFYLVYSSPHFAISGSCLNSSDCVNDPSSGQWTKDSLMSYGDGAGKIGIYYNYCAASAGSYCYGRNGGDEIGSPSGNATEDICPASWRMPTGGSSGEYQTLYAAYNSNASNFKNAFRIFPSGQFNRGEAGYQGTYGYFWSSTFSNGGAMHGLRVYSSDYALRVGSQEIDPQQGITRFVGFQVRCILDPPFDYTISYNKNTTDAVSNMPSSQTGATNLVRPATLSNNVPSRSGYTFTGWCDTQPTTLNGVDSCPGIKINSGGEYAISPNSPNVTLYARWAPNSSIMQNVTSSTCPTTRTQVVDSRDGSVYDIQKLTYGSTTLCWMTTNLNLMGGITLTPDDSNVSSNYTLPASGVSGFENGNVYNSGSTTCGNNSPCYSYYSFTAATAGTNPSSGTATSDICPKGWRLPTRTEYTALKNAYTTGATLTASPWYGVYAGYYRSGFQSGGSYVWYISSTVYNSAYAYYLGFNSSSAQITDLGHKSDGSSIRCVAK